MKKMLVILLAVLVIAITYNESFAEKSTYVNSIKFIQYLDENTALEEVKKANSMDPKSSNINKLLAVIRSKKK